MPCVWIKLAYFCEEWSWLIWSQILRNLYRLEEDLVSVPVWPEIAYLAKLKTWSQTWNLEWPSMPSLSAYRRIYPKIEDYETKNKIHVDIKYKWEKMVAASISTSLNLTVDQNCDCRHSLPQFIFCKMMPCTMFQSIQTFCERQIY